MFVKMVQDVFLKTTNGILCVIWGVSFCIKEYVNDNHR
jgi:hypothetical protein